MSKTYNIYWSACDRDTGRKYLKYKPESLYKVIKQEYREYENFDTLLMCPSFRNELKKTYLIRADIDFTITYDKETKSLNTNMYDQAFFDRNIVLENSQSNIIQLNWFYYFFSEDSIELTVQSPYYHNMNTSALFVSASLDIGNWLRPLLPAYIFKNSGNLCIKRGEPLFYIRLNIEPDAQINFIKYNHTAEIDKEIKEYMDTKIYNTYNKHKSLDPYYNLFKKNNLNNKMLNIIRNNVEK